MKLADLRSAYDYHTQKAGDISRHLGFAGIALIWIFKTVDPNGKPFVPQELIAPGILIVVSLTLDILQYVVGSATWGIFNRNKEKKQTKEEDEFTAHPLINWPGIGLFWLKLAAIIAAYGFIISYLDDLLWSV